MKKHHLFFTIFPLVGGEPVQIYLRYKRYRVPVGAGARLTGSVHLHVINLFSTIPSLSLLPIYGLTSRKLF